MAVAVIADSSLQLKFITGNDATTGEPTTKTKSFNNVKTNANADQLFSIATVLAGLQQHTLGHIIRKDDSNITEE